MTLSVTNQFQRKQVIESAKVNTNFNDIVSYVNDLETAVGSGTAIGTGAVTTDKIADNAVTNAKLTDDCVTSVELRDDAVTDANRAVTTDHIRDAAITAAKIATAVAGNGLSGGGGSALAVNVDNSTIEINSDSLRLKDGGTTEAKLASGVVTKLGQNIGLKDRVSVQVSGTGHTTFEDVLNYSGQGRLDGISFNHVARGAGADYEIKITVDAGPTQTLTFSAAPPTTGHIKFNVGNSTTLFQSDTGSVGTMNELNLFFNTSILIQHRFSVSNGLNDATTYVQYERQA